MRAFPKPSNRWLSEGWLLPLVLLALPDCSTLADADPWPLSEEPQTSAVMCDIPRPFTTQCADPNELALNFSTMQAAIALATNQKSVNNLALDFTTPNQCPNNLPLRTEFFGPYPDGFQACLNCASQIPVPFPDGNAYCVERCKELLASDGEPDPPDGIDNFCQMNARVSTNFDKTMCFHGVCSSDGIALAFNDKRRDPEDVIWMVDPNDGTQATGSTLKRTAETTGGGNGDFNAGSQALQVIEKGDAWIELEVGDAMNETSLSHVLGVSHCPSPCDKNNPPPDTDRSLNDIQFMLSLNNNGDVNVVENPGLIIHGPIGDPYEKGERFRVKIVHNPDGSATISFQRSCTPGATCDANEFFTSNAPATYPLRIDTSFREKDASLAKVTVVRIK